MSRLWESFDPWAWQTSEAVLAQAQPALDVAEPIEWCEALQHQLSEQLDHCPASFQSVALAQQLLRQPASESLRLQADQLRSALVGDTVTYVVNRNLNFTNHCLQHCSFCAFRRDPGAEGAYWHGFELLQERAAEAQGLGATELCIQGD